MSRSADISPLSVLLSRVDAAADGSPSRETVPSGFASLDAHLGGGFRRGDLIVLGGDASSGKSALALAFAVRTAAQGKRVAFLSGEMSVDRVLERIIAIEARVTIDALRQGTLDDTTRAAAGVTTLRLRDRLPIIDRLRMGQGAGGVASMLDDLSSIDFLIVDPLPAVASGSRPLDEEVATVVRDLKALALDRETAILATAPLPHLSPRPDRRPTLDDFGALGSMKQHADVVLGLFRQDMYEPSRDIEGATELLIRKNRNGTTGFVDLYFYAQWMRFEDMLDPDR